MTTTSEFDNQGNATEITVTTSGAFDGWGSYAMGFQSAPPGIEFVDGAVLFTANPFGGLSAITIGEAQTYGLRMGPNDQAYETYGMPNGHTVFEHEMQHVYQGQILGPLYLPAAALSLLTGWVINGNTHGAASYMETGPQSQPPRKWGR